MKSSANVVIVGATSLGCAAADALSSLGWSGIQMLDRGRIPGSVDFPDIDPGFMLSPLAGASDIALLRETRQISSDLSFSGEPAFDAVGSIIIATSDHGMRVLEARSAVLAAKGIRSVILSPQETLMRLPLISPAQIKGALWAPGDGLLRSHVIRAALARRAVASADGRHDHDDTSVIARGNVNVTGVSGTSGDWLVNTPLGRVQTRFVIWCGPGAPEHFVTAPQIKAAVAAAPKDGADGYEAAGGVGRSLYVETTPLTGLRWLADREVTLPAIHHLESGLSLRQRHNCLGIGSRAATTHRHDQSEGQALIAAASGLFPDLLQAAVSTRSLVAGLPSLDISPGLPASAGLNSRTYQATGREPTSAPETLSAFATAIAAHRVPPMVTIGLGRHIARTMTGCAEDHLPAQIPSNRVPEAATDAGQDDEAPTRWKDIAQKPRAGITLH